MPVVRASYTNELAMIYFSHGRRCDLRPRVSLRVVVRCYRSWSLRAFFRDRFVDVNVWGFEKMYKMTRFPVFKMQAEQTRIDDSLDLIRITGGIAFAIAGVLTFLSLLGIQVNF